MSTPAPARRLHASRGFSLIEILIAVAVLAIGLLSVAALQIQGVRQNFDSYARSQATLLANDYVERLYANKPAVDVGLYANFDTATINCAAAPAQICGTQSNSASAVCTPAQMATYDQYIVACGYVTANGQFGGVRDLLQNGRMQVTCIDAAGAALPAPCALGARHRVAMTWTEQVKNGNNRFVAQTPQDLVVTVQP